MRSVSRSPAARRLTPARATMLSSANTTGAASTGHPGPSVGALGFRETRACSSSGLEGRGTHCGNHAKRALRRKAQMRWPRAELNHRHKDFQSSALPTELLGHELQRPELPFVEAPAEAANYTSATGFRRPRPAGPRSASAQGWATCRATLQRTATVRATSLSEPLRQGSAPPRMCGPAHRLPRRASRRADRTAGSRRRARPIERASGN